MRRPKQRDLEKAHEQPAPSGASCYDLARDLAGSVKGLPKDLFRNPRYMEDFGALKKGRRTRRRN